MSIWGLIGADAQLIDDLDPGPGWTRMEGERPSMDHLARADGTWQLSHDRLRSTAKERLNADFAIAMAALHEGWPDYEIQTWTVQAEEARQWTAAPPDAKPSVPFLSSLHAQREAMGWDGTLADLVERVIENTNAYTAATASLIGRRHVAERAIDGAEDPASIIWDFSLAGSYG
ncbi:hypothetical protein SAMN05216588_101203 [Pseudomonas flavescens]|uniref:DUF4376 domain-containing protein n=2 Tax=Phytopseudomonas flavescens TaxID=29435 RepID=A0A1G7XPT0_9GAMM|nr:hypothetical protein SAMN05216588_101203 [Pseudomonas flavescens]